ncbi:MAG: hypothetical protein ACTSUG_09210 [Candidatus Helarchaeota archaeon]
MKILQINKLNDNSINRISTNKNVSVFSDKDISDNVLDFNHIIIGVRDGGDEFDIDKLIEARNKGKTIIFTHDNPVLSLSLLENEEEKDWEIRNNIYLKKLKDNFGIEGCANNYQYEFYDTIEVKSDNVIPVGSYSIKETHLVGIILSDKYEIIADSPQCKKGKTNYYLAILKEIGKGDVIMWNAGHLNYGHDKLEDLTDIEKTILNNIIK